MGKTEKKGKKSRNKVTKIPKTKRRKYEMNEIYNGIQTQEFC